MSSPKQVTLFFIHGLGGDSTLFSHQSEHFAARYQFKAIDLPGHGTQKNAAHPADLNSLVSFIKEELIQIEGPYYVIGHSTGALAALELAALELDGMKGAVLLDPPTMMPAEVIGGMAPLTEAFQSPHYREALTSFAGQAFFRPNDKSTRKAALLDKIKNISQSALIEIWQSLLAYDPRAALKNCKLPLLLVQSGVEINFSEWLACCPHLEPARTACAGHFAFIEAFDQVNAMIESFITSPR